MFENSIYYIIYLRLWKSSVDLFAVLWNFHASSFVLPFCWCCYPCSRVWSTTHVFVSDIPFHPRMPDHKLNGDVHWTLQHLLLPTVPTCFPIYAVNKAGVLQIRFSLFVLSLFIYWMQRVSQGSCERESVVWSKQNAHTCKLSLACTGSQPGIGGECVLI